MIPLIGHVNELKTAKDILVRVANEVMTEKVSQLITNSVL